MLGTLYVVATPIGNLEDLSPRARRLLREVELLYAEDTRSVRRLLSDDEREGSPARSLFEGNEAVRSEEVAGHLAAGRDVVLVSEAGTPAVSDPGYRAVRAAIELGAPVVPVPGPSAVLAALVASGLPTDAFRFGGFLPREAGARRRLLEQLKEDPATQVFFESPKRIPRTMADVEAVLGPRQMALCRELTKLHETIYRGTPAQVLQQIGEETRGEATLVIAGAPATPVASPEEMEAAVREALAQGATVRDASRMAAEATGGSRKAAYRLALALGRSDGEGEED